MFESLSERLGGVFDRLTKAGALTEADVVAALREVRVALLEADVSLPVARDFIKRVQEKATGAAVTKSFPPSTLQSNTRKGFFPSRSRQSPSSSSRCGSK